MKIALILSLLFLGFNQVPVPKPTVQKQHQLCGPGSVTLVASKPVEGVVKWYTKLEGSTVIHTGNSYTTPTLTESRTFWISLMDSNGRESERVDVVVKVLDKSECD